MIPNVFGSVSPIFIADGSIIRGGVPFLIKIIGPSVYVRDSVLPDGLDFMINVSGNNKPSR